MTAAVWRRMWQGILLPVAGFRDPAGAGKKKDISARPTKPLRVEKVANRWEE